MVSSLDRWRWFAGGCAAAKVTLLSLLPSAACCCKSEFIAAQKIDPRLEVSNNNDIRGQLANAWSFVPPALRTALHMEFGVRQGGSIRFMARNVTGPSTQWDGFDSFEGLPTDRTDHIAGWAGGRYTTHGKLPEVPDNVKLHKGWFNETVPSFLDSMLQRGQKAVGFTNMDADLYISTITVFDAVFSRCMHRNGTVISFDELFGTHKILAHEWKALTEAKNKYRLSWHWVSFARTPQSRFARAAIQVDNCGRQCNTC